MVVRQTMVGQPAATGRGAMGGMRAGLEERATVAGKGSSTKLADPELCPWILWGSPSSWANPSTLPIPTLNPVNPLPLPTPWMPPHYPTFLHSTQSSTMLLWPAPCHTGTPPT